MNNHISYTHPHHHTHSSCTHRNRKLPAYSTEFWSALYFSVYVRYGFFPASLATIVVTGTVPCFSILYSKIIDNQHITTYMHAGLACVLASVFLGLVGTDVKDSLNSSSIVIGLFVCLGAGASYTMRLRYVKNSA